MASTSRQCNETELREEIRDVRRRQILRSAGALFGEVGYQHASMEQIAARVGLTKTALYYYFPDKSKILMQCFALGRQVVDEAFEYAMSQDVNGLERVATFVRRYVLGITAELGACALTLEIRSAPPEELPRLLSAMRGLDRQLRDFVAAGIEDGSCTPVDPALAVNWIMGAMVLIPRWYRSGKRLSAEDVAEEFATYTRRMLAAAPG